MFYCSPSDILEGMTGPDLAGLRGTGLAEGPRVGLILVGV